MRDTTPIEQDEWGGDVHPSFGLVRVSRVSSTGHHLFDSEIAHREFVTLVVRRASRKRDLHHDRIHERGPHLIEIAMSMAQWADLISSFGNWSGVPCTIEFDENGVVPAAPHSSRLAESHAEVLDAGNKAFEDISAAFEAFKEKPTKGNRDTLEARIRNAPLNMDFAAKSLTEHAEKVVTKARADVEAMVRLAAEQQGLNPGTTLAISATGVES